MAAPLSVSDFPTILTLPYDTDMLAMCDASRSAALQFLNAAIAGAWGRRELEGWLRGPYAMATSYARVLADPNEVANDACTEAIAGVTETDALRAIWTAHRETMEFLFGLPEPTGTGPFVVASVRDGLVARAEDRRGAPCWVPKCGATQALGARVQALLAADFLMRSEDYGSQLSICSRCSRVEFDALSRARGVCLDETTSSVVRGRRDTEVRALLVYR